MRHRRGFVWAAGVAALLVMGLSSCSDDEETLTEEEFLEQGNEICKEGTARVEAIGEELGASPTEDEIEAALDETWDDIEGQIDDIRDLAEPDDLSDDVNAALDQAEEDVDAARDLGADILEAEEDPFADTNELFADIGLTECADG